MNLTLARALVLDALYQVLDNKVFRILLILIGLLVLFPLLLGFREEHIVFLFGWKTFAYDELFTSMGGAFGVPMSSIGAMETSELQLLCIQAYQGILVEGLMGTIGLFICLAATAFFVPQMIEKGAADTVFSKPVGRMTLLLARFFTGILFVGLLALVLVVGTHVALLIGSGASETAFLWNALALTYKFGLVYSVTILVAVFTRSTVASILLSLIFMTFNGCVHLGWKTAHMHEETAQSFQQPAETPQGGLEVTIEVDDDEPALEDDDDEEGGFFYWLGRLFFGLHYALPKTGDAAAIVEKLRGRITGGDRAAFEDDEVDFVLQDLPEGWRPLDPAALGDPELHVPPSADGAVLYAAEAPGDPPRARLLVHRRSLERYESDSGRLRTESSKRAADAFEEWLEADETRQLLSEDRSAELAAGTTWSRRVRHYQWTAVRGDGDWTIETYLVRDGEWFVTLQLERPASRELDEAALDHFGGRDYMFGSGSLAAANRGQDPDAWFAEKLDWGGDWRFSIWFSVTSSLGFVLVCLLLAWVRLGRMDF